MNVPSGSELARPFVPAKDFGLSKRFYEAIGFEKLLDLNRKNAVSPWSPITYSSVAEADIRALLKMPEEQKAQPVFWEEMKIMRVLSGFLPATFALVFLAGTAHSAAALCSGRGETT